MSHYPSFLWCVWVASFCGVILDGTSVLAAKKEEKWGNLSVTFLYDGQPPPRREWKIDKDREATKLPILDPSLMVDAKSKGIANVVAWLDVPKGERPPPHHPDYDKLIDKPVKIEFRNLQIEPHVLGLWTKQTLHAVHIDPVGHNLHVHSPANPMHSTLIPSGNLQTYSFKKPESQPIPMDCSIHHRMSGFVIIQEHPYFGVSTAEGKLTLRNLPVGKHTIVLWHERGGFITKGKRGDKPREWTKGRITLEIKPSENDLGEFLIKPERRNH